MYVSIWLIWCMYNIDDIQTYDIMIYYHNCGSFQDPSWVTPTFSCVSDLGTCHKPGEEEPKKLDLDDMEGLRQHAAGYGGGAGAGDIRRLRHFSELFQTVQTFQWSLFYQILSLKRPSGSTWTRSGGKTWSNFCDNFPNMSMNFDEAVVPCWYLWHFVIGNPLNYALGFSWKIHCRRT